ncbi:hypothetical protein JHK87_021740 [Glycine soja]|nr:hypothetical protein JHK87_021740 [Glycine soja]
MLPPYLLGFIFYVVLSPSESPHIACCPSIGCEWYLGTSHGERINTTSFFLDKDIMFYHERKYESTTEHVFLWYDAPLCQNTLVGSVGLPSNSAISSK